MSAFGQDPTDPSVMYAGGHRGIYKSVDGGRSFDLVTAPLWYYDVVAIAVDPTAPSVVYVTTVYSGLFKSVDGGATWSMVSSGSFYESDMTIDRTGALLVAQSNGVRKSTDGGITWTSLLLLRNKTFRAVFVDPSNPDLILAGAGYLDGFDHVGTILRSTDGGASWTEIPGEFGGAGAIMKIRKDSTHGTIYAAGYPGMWRSDDDGVSFTRLKGFDAVRSVTFVVDASTDPPTIYTVNGPTQGHALNRSTDGGETSSELLINGSVPYGLLDLTLVGPSSLLLAEWGTANAFVMSVETSVTGPDSLVYSTYLKGTGGAGAHGIAVDAFGHAYVTGSTGSGDFPLTVADPPRVIPGGNAWVVELGAGGAELLYANQLSVTGVANTYTSAGAIAIDTSGKAYISGVTSDAGGAGFVAMLPPDGSSFDVFALPGVSQLGSTGIALHSSGAAYVVGTAGSGFPATENSFQPWYAGGGDAFITKAIFDTSSTVRR